MDPTISPSCATWLSTSCERTTPSLPCVESSSSQAGMTNTWTSLSLNFEMRLPCIGRAHDHEAFGIGETFEFHPNRLANGAARAVGTHEVERLHRGATSVHIFP